MSDADYSNSADGFCQSCGEATAEPWHAYCFECYREEQGWDEPEFRASAPRRPDPDALRWQHEERTRVVALDVLERLNELERRVARLEHQREGREAA